MKKCWYIFLIAATVLNTSIHAMVPIQDVEMQDVETPLHDNNNTPQPITLLQRCCRNQGARSRYCLGCAKRERAPLRAFLFRRLQYLLAQTGAN